MSSLVKTILTAAAVSLAVVYLNNHDILPGFFKPSAEEGAAAGAGDGKGAATAG